eukprot:scaffold208_cov63-Attheya_sp.AAC.7
MVHQEDTTRLPTMAMGVFLVLYQQTILVFYLLSIINLDGRYALCNIEAGDTVIMTVVYAI